MNNDAVLIQQIHPNTPGTAMLELSKERHHRYCKKWNIDYRPLFVNATPEIPVEAGNWSRVKLLLDAMQEEYEYVFWLDADTLIYDMNTDMRDAVIAGRVGASWHRIPQLNHWNIGALYIHNTEGTRQFVSDWLAGYKDNHPQWLEQGVFNKLAMQGRTVVTVSDRWNATLDVNMVPDAVVLGFHGQGDTEYRTNMMRKALDRISKLESAQATQE